ncbi:MAG TPA: B12-binding domain-containing radical SAM protein [Nitrospirae bacterium]|nr:B12-binding domain-containing radical SAM protein [Nitrospirota bacterium]
MRQLKILFLYPNYAYVGIGAPVGVASIAAAIKEKGFDFDFFDTSFILKVPKLNDFYSAFKAHATADDIVPQSLDVVVEQFKNEFDLSSYDIVLVSTLTRTHNIGLQLIKAVKEVNPSAYVIVGGLHPVVAPEETIRDEGIDCICIGEGDEGIVELLQRIAKDLSFKDVQGFWFNDNGTITRNQDRFENNLDAMPLPDYSFFRKEHFATAFDGKIYNTLPVEISRGCLYKCSFCHHSRNGGVGTYRKYSVRVAIDKLKKLKEMYDVEFFRFVDESLSFMSKDYFRELSELYAKEVGVPFVVMTNAHTLDDETAGMLKKMNCVAISMGVEHGNEDFRINMLDKKLKDKHVYNAFSLLKKHGIRATAYFLVGLPHETREMAFASIRMNKRLVEEFDAAPSGVPCFHPYPGTKLTKICHEENLLADNISEDYACLRPALDMPQFSYDEINGIYRTFFAYSVMPEKYWPLVELCEKESKASDKMLQTIMNIHTK